MDKPNIVAVMIEPGHGGGKGILGDLLGKGEFHSGPLREIVDIDGLLGNHGAVTSRVVAS